MEDILIRVYSGESIEDKCEAQRHPLNEVKRAKEIVESGNTTDCYSNSPDFVSAIKYLSEKHSIKSEFFLNGESFGDDIEPIFEDFNRAFILMDSII